MAARGLAQPGMAELKPARTSGASATSRQTAGERGASSPAGASAQGERASAPGERGARRARGAFYTPPALVEFLVDVAARLGGTPRRILDPSCGDGRVLAACRRRWPDADLVGWDIDPDAVAATRGFGIPAELRDGLLDGMSEFAPLQIRTTINQNVSGRGVDERDSTFDLVIGNPPFLGQLQGSTVQTPERAKALRARYPELGAYTDTAAMFLLRASQLAPVVVLVQPISTLAARDAEAIRASVGPRLGALWVARARMFEDAGVEVCVVGLRGSEVSGELLRWVGPQFEALPPLSERTEGTTWSPLIPEGFGLPAFNPATSGTLGDLATATADFRDEYYALAEHVREAEPGDIPVIVSGHIDPGVCLWGQTTVRLNKRAWTRPAVPPDTVLPGRLSGWVRRRTVPKVLLAAQSRVLEAIADPEGRYLPVTPVVTVQPHDAADVWRLLAVLLSPFATAWALREYGGTGMSGGAIKLAAKQVCRLPLPENEAAWARAAARLKADELDVTAEMDAAYGVDLAGWYRERASGGARPVDGGL